MACDWLDRIDVKLLAILQAEGRISNVALAERVALSPTPCLRRVKRLEDAGLISRYRAELNRRAIGLDVTAFVYVNIDSHGPAATQAFVDATKVIDQIIACHVLTGAFDFMLEVVTPTLDDYANVMLDRLGGLPGVGALQTCFALRSIRSGQDLPLGHLAEGRPAVGSPAAGHHATGTAA